jgi:hypothetical protein
MPDEEPPRQIPPETLQSQAAFSTWLQSLPPPPQSFAIGEDINWKAPWLEVVLRVELPFWLLVNNTNLEIPVEGYKFPVSISGETFELHVGGIADSKRTVIYSGPIKQLEEIKAASDILSIQPNVRLVWRKCKTLLRITTRCNGDVWEKVQKAHRPSIDYYLQTLCRAHIPVINKLIQHYRLATYDFFGFEVAPWDVPNWYIERESIMKCILLVPYRGWDHRPLQLPDDAGNERFYQLVDSNALQAQMADTPTPGELELLDAINLMERGSYSDAVRRVTTAIEVVVEWSTMNLIDRKEGKRAAVKFIKETRTNFPKRIQKFGELNGQTLSAGLTRELARTRSLRHKIVHRGYRISPAERGAAQRSIDTGRWIFNLFEKNEQKRKIRESKIAYRSLGRELLYDVFQVEITPDGVTLSQRAPAQMGPAASTKATSGPS